MKVEKILLSDVDSLEFELTDVQKSPEPTKQNYVNNKELQAEFVKYYATKQQWIADGKPGNPPLTTKIGQAILDISTRRTYSRNFIGYTQAWKEEMIGDAIETCVKYSHNYNPEKYNNPFAYLTQLVTNAIIQRIKREKCQTYIKYKAFDNAEGFHGYLDGNVSEDEMGQFNETADMYSDYLHYIADYEEKHLTKKPKDDVEDEYEGVLQFLV
jgi:DNA-directed RNA polymerase specialized sigma24 family protein